MKAILVTTLLLSIGCGTNDGTSSTADLEAEAATITKLEVVATSSIASNAPPALNLTIVDPAVARAVYTITFSLAPFPPGGYSCPIDWGVTYQLTFFSNDEPVATAAADPNGCNAVNVAGPSESAPLRADDAYWSSLSGELGISETLIYPYSPS